jgi:hypothetical protein
MIDLTAISYDGAGNQRWVARYDGPGNGWDRAYKILYDDLTGGVYITGSTVGIGTSYDSTTIAYDAASGAQRWLDRYSGPGNDRDETYSIAKDAFGNIYVTGGSVNANLDSDYITIAYDQKGTVLWLKRYDGPVGGHDSAAPNTMDGSGNLYVSGSSQGASSRDMVTIKYPLNPIILKTATEQLITDVESLNLDDGVENSLTSKLDNAMVSIEKDRPSAGGQVGSFVNEVEAQRGKALTDAQADELSADGQRIIDNLS